MGVRVLPADAGSDALTRMEGDEVPDGITPPQRRLLLDVRAVLLPTSI